MSEINIKLKRQGISKFLGVTFFPTISNQDPDGVLVITNETLVTNAVKANGCKIRNYKFSKGKTGLITEMTLLGQYQDDNKLGGCIVQIDKVPPHVKLSQLYLSIFAQVKKYGQILFLFPGERDPFELYVEISKTISFQRNVGAYILPTSTKVIIADKYYTAVHMTPYRK